LKPKDEEEDDLIRRRKKRKIREVGDELDRLELRMCRACLRLSKKSRGDYVVYGLLSGFIEAARAS